MINIYVNNGAGIPDDETCYIIGKDGIMLKKTLELIESLTPVDKISFLEPLPTYARMKIPMMPVRMFANILGFFQEVYDKYKSEAIVLLFFNKSKKSYRVFVPDQEVSPASLKYKTDKTIKDHILIGTIHSHGSMSAFHSGIDVNDEAKFDGIHITIGKVNGKDFFDICGSIAVNGMRVPINPEEYVIGLEQSEYTNFFPQMFRPNFQEINGEKFYLSDVKPSVGFILNAEEEDFLFDKSWLNKVKEKVYENTYQGYSSGKRYTFKDGKLVEIKDDKKPTNLDFNSILFSNRNSKKDEIKDECICKKCIFRCDKLKMEDLAEVNEVDLTNEFFGSDDWWETGFYD